MLREQISKHVAEPVLGKERNQCMLLASKTQIKKNKMLITPCFYIAPICEAAQIFLQIKKKI